jgi:acetolactate synthase-1/2/3 large subunit
VVPSDTITEVAKALRSGERCALLLGGRALRADGLRAASRVAVTSSALLLGETFPANLERGAGIPAVDRLAYLAEMAQAQLEGVRHLVLVDAKSPVSFFAYPGKAGDLVPPGCTVHTLARPGEDAPGALETLAEALGAPDDGGVPAPAMRPDRPSGAVTAETLAAAVGATLPEGAIVVDEGNTSGLFVPAATAGAPRHDWLTLTGGAIGIGLPMATGAAVAAPERPVLCLQADGSAMYTLQALWTQAREGLNVTTLLLSNRSYAILNMELHRVGADAGGPLARRLLDLTDPDLDFCELARGMGVPARRVENAEDLTAALAAGFAGAGPNLVEVVL